MAGCAPPISAILWEGPVFVKAVRAHGSRNFGAGRHRHRGQRPDGLRGVDPSYGQNSRALAHLPIHGEKSTVD